MFVQLLSEAVSFLLSCNTQEDKLRSVLQPGDRTGGLKRTRHAQSETRSEGPRRKTGGCLLFFFREVFRMAASTSQADTEAQPLRHTNACTYRWRFSENSSRQLGTSICQLLREFRIFCEGKYFQMGSRGNTTHHFFGLIFFLNWKWCRKVGVSLFRLKAVAPSF